MGNESVQSLPRTLSPPDTIRKKRTGAVKSTKWATPNDVFDALNKVFYFVADMAAEEGNAKCPIFISKEINALTEDWTHWADPGEAVFLNPPYGLPQKPNPKTGFPGNPCVGAFLKKAYLESRKGITVVCLIHAKTDTKFWTNWVGRAAEKWMIEGRIRFLDPETGLPARAGPTYGQAVVVFRPGYEGPPREIRVNRKMEQIHPRKIVRMKCHQ